MVFQLDNVKQTARVASLNMECTVQGFKGTRSNLCFLQTNGYEHFPDKWTLDVQHDPYCQWRQSMWVGVAPFRT